ncbi:MAG: Smr/MutS family protein [Desulfocapsa sp.]|uniref:Smr/MutS family protein n=1 Tax=Desulfotalea psychrophila TaxID=84980 RepID=A0ABS3AXF7_9BACT|nr:Smr/MutS family protein [Desulfocapsa sp.]MBN4068567.1 Smr/MutS family protein [Desulfotalea psychrophila]
MKSCQICGNGIDFRSVRCPYCGSEQKGEEQSESKPGKIQFLQKTINLEQGLPTVQQALIKLEQEITTARLEKIRVLTLIHGYGSTGKGGAIRLECRRTLDYLRSKGEIAQVIYGEDFSRRHGSVKQLLSRFPDLSRHPHLNNHNKGISIVLLF